MASKRKKSKTRAKAKGKVKFERRPNRVGARKVKSRHENVSEVHRVRRPTDDYRSMTKKTSMRKDGL